MAIRTVVNIHAVDGKGHKSVFSYESLADIPSAGNVSSLVASWKNMTRLGYSHVTVTYKTDDVAVPADDIGARLGDTATLECWKGEEFGGTYTFKLAAIKEALLNSDGSLLYQNAAFTDWAEWFDDGSGLFGLQGPFTLSDGEQLAENGAAPTLPSGYTTKGGKTKARRY